jgi:hypothetical protein
LWVVQGLLGFVFFMAGMFKTIKSREELEPKVGNWVMHFPPQVVKMIAISEVLGGLGLVLPMATGIMPELTPLAAGCLLLVMLGAVGTHFKLGTPKRAIGPVILATLCAVVLWGRCPMAQG